MKTSYALKKLTDLDGFDEETDSLAAKEILEGLTAEQKYIPSKYFYDARGSKLFEEICDLPEYYPTDCELELLSTHAEEIVRGLRDVDLVELGAGSNRKIRILLDAMDESTRSRMRYVPVDVSVSALEESASQLSTLYPELKVQGVVADFNRDLHNLPADRAKVALFLGSTIGNLDKESSASFLKNVAITLNPGDRFLLGLDMVKRGDIIEAAYNDSQNVTAEFNKNMLHVVNRELGAGFDPTDFDHVALFNEDRERVEMRLRAAKDLAVEIDNHGTTIKLKAGETILTEICRKFRREGAERMIRDAGMKVSRWYTDSKRWFSLLEAVLDVH